MKVRPIYRQDVSALVEVDRKAKEAEAEAVARRQKSKNPNGAVAIQTKPPVNKKDILEIVRQYQTEERGATKFYVVVDGDNLLGGYALEFAQGEFIVTFMTVVPGEAYWEVMTRIAEEIKGKVERSPRRKVVTVRVPDEDGLIEHILPFWHSQGFSTKLGRGGEVWECIYVKEGK